MSKLKTNTSTLIDSRNYTFVLYGMKSAVIQACKRNCILQSGRPCSKQKQDTKSLSC